MCLVLAWDWLLHCLPSCLLAVCCLLSTVYAWVLPQVKR